MRELEQWFADHMKKARGSVEYWQERAKIEYGELVIAKKSIAELEGKLEHSEMAATTLAVANKEYRKRIAELIVESVVVQPTSKDGK